jgi:hypothetical protein
MRTDLETFMKTYPPKAKISCMEKYVSQILHLKKNGYSNPQIRDWLEMNQIVVTHQAVRQFIISRTTKSAHLETE